MSDQVEIDLTKLVAERCSAITAARTTDPATSHVAAADRTLAQLRSDQLDVYELFENNGPCHDELLVERYRRNVAEFVNHPQSDSGLRTRRHELVQGGFLRDSGRRAATRCGRESIIWEIVPGSGA